MNKDIDITALGEILIDFTPYGKTELGYPVYGQNPGGAPANLLCAVSKYGGRTAFIGKAGADMFGDFLAGILHECNVDCSGLVRDAEHNTTLAFVALDEHGDRKFSFCRRYGADRFLEKSEVRSELIERAKVFHFGTLSLTDEPSASATDYALEIAKNSNTVVSFDPNFRPLLWRDESVAAATIRKYLAAADIAKLSVEEAEMATCEKGTERLGKAVLALGPSVALITDGANGVDYFTRGGSGHVPAAKVKAVDTTGAGDIFYGSFLFEFLRLGKRPDALMADEARACAEFATAAAGISVTRKGAIPSIPEYTEVKKI